MTVRSWLTAAFTSLTIGPTVSAIEPPLARSTAKMDDAKVALNVKAALNADRELSGLNLFVSVLDGVVAIQGPIPQPKLKDAIEQRAKAVTGVSTVKVDCFSIDAGDPLKAEVAKRLMPVPKEEAAAVLPTVTGGLPSVAVVPPIVPLSPPTADDLPSTSTTANTVTVQRPTEAPLPMMAGGLLSAPVAVVAKPVTLPSIPDAPKTARPYPTIAPPHVPILPVGMKAVSADDVAFALIDLRKSDPRFAGLTASVANGVVTISGEADPAAIEDFSNAAKTLSGVMRVDFK